jgi:hypothetical protein
MPWWGVLITVFGSLAALGFFIVLGLVIANFITIGKEFKNIKKGW